MIRTTISINEFMLEQVKTVSKKEKKTFGEVISELVSIGLHSKRERARSRKIAAFKIKSYSMGKPRINLEDKEALHKILDKRSDSAK